MFLHCRTSPSPGLMAELSVLLSTTSSPMHSTTNLCGRSLPRTGGKTSSWPSPPARSSRACRTSWRRRTCPAWSRSGGSTPRWSSPTSRRSTECATSCRDARSQDNVGEKDPGSGGSNYCKMTLINLLTSSQTKRVWNLGWSISSKSLLKATSKLLWALESSLRSQWYVFQ